MIKLLRRLFELLVKAQAAIGLFLTRLPFWSEVEKLSILIVGPVRGLSGFTLRRLPFLKRFEKYLEIETLRKRPPVILAISILFVIYRGLQTTKHGHIGTDEAVFPFLTIVSGFNPFLGGVCGIAFGAADFVQKLVRPDMFGAETWSNPNYTGAMAGYIVAYSATIWMGIFPGLLSRVGRVLAMSWFQKWRAARAARHADGATPPPEDSLAGAVGLVGGVVGGLTGGYVGVRHIVTELERPAFYWRPSPDVSCYEDEVQTLIDTAPKTATTGAIGGAIGATQPPVKPPTPPKPPEEGGGGGGTTGGAPSTGGSEPATSPPEDGGELNPEPSPYDDEGYDKNGFNEEGYDRVGYDEDGYDKTGYDKNGFAKTGLNREGYDKDGFDKNGFNKDGYDAQGKDKNGLSELDKGNRDKLEKVIELLKSMPENDHKWMLIKKVQNAAQITGAHGIPQGNMDAILKVVQSQVKRGDGQPPEYWAEVVKNFSSNLSEEVAKTWENVKMAPAALGYYTVKTAVATYDAIQDGTVKQNLKWIGDAYAETIIDFVEKPQESVGKVVEFYGETNDKIVNIMKAVVDDPVEFGKLMFGVDAWEKSLDPDIPLDKRLLYSMWGTIDMGMTIASMGATAKVKLGSGVLTATDLVKNSSAVKKVAGTSKAVAVGDKVSDVIKTGSIVDKLGETGKTLDLVDTGSDTAKTVDIADAGSDTAKTVDIADASGDSAKGSQVVGEGTDAGTASKVDDWDEAKLQGKQKVDEFEKALESSDPEKIKKAMLDLQGDKQALQQINKRPSSVKAKYNQNLEKLQYEPTDTAVREQFAKQYGVDPKDIKISTGSNPTQDLNKVGADKDYVITVKTGKEKDLLDAHVLDPKRHKELLELKKSDPDAFNDLVKNFETTVPPDEAAKIYNDEYLKVAHADDPEKLADLQKLKETDLEAYDDMAKKFAKKQDQDPMGPKRPGGYGGSEDFQTMIKTKEDLRLAIKHGKIDPITGKIGGYDLKDPTAVGKAMGYKSHEWFQDAQHLADAGHKVEAQKFFAEGMRQTPKQFEILQKRHEVLKLTKGDQLKGIPPLLKKQVDLINEVNAGLKSPADVIAELKVMGSSPTKVATDVGEYMEAIQKLGKKVIK